MRLLNKDCLDKKLDALKAKLDEFKEPSSLVFALFSDLHTSGVQTESTDKLVEALDAVCKRVNPDAVINLGDNLAMLGRTEHIANDQLLSVFSGLFDKIKSASNAPLFILNGNHDGIGTDFFKPEFFNSAVKGKYDDGLAKYDGEGSADSYNNDKQADFLMLFVIDNDTKQYTAIHVNRDTVAEIDVLGVAGNID